MLRSSPALAAIALLLVGCSDGAAAPVPLSPAAARPPAARPPAPSVPEPDAPQVEPAPSAPPSVAPLVTAEVPIPETGDPPVVPALRTATRIGPGPWIDDLAIALGAGFIDFGTGAEVEVIRELEHRRARYVLAAAPPRGAPVEHERALELRSIWLAQLESRVDPDEGVDVHRRVAAILLYDQALPSEPLDPATGVITTPFTCAAETDLRARDLDGDGETELTAIVAFLRPTQEQWGGGGTPDECGAVAFLVGADDWNVQAAFTRDYAVQAFAAAIEVGERRETTWQLRDIDGDGRSDLRIIDRWRYSNYFMGDSVGGGETEPGAREAASDRRDIDCLYSVEHDAWRCPAPTPGQLLFEDPQTRSARRGVRPW